MPVDSYKCRMPARGAFILLGRRLDAVRRAKRMNASDPLRYGPVVQNMLLQDAFTTVGGDLAIPDALGINKKPRTADADSKAASLGPHNGQFQLRTAALEIVPSGLSFRQRRTVGTETKEEMTPGAIETSGSEAFV